MTPIIKSLLRFVCNFTNLRKTPWPCLGLKGNQPRYPRTKGNQCLKKTKVAGTCRSLLLRILPQAKLAPATQGIEWLNQWRNMDAEAFALIGTGFDCHVQRRLIKKKTAKSPKIAATIRKHLQDQVVFFFKCSCISISIFRYQ